MHEYILRHTAVGLLLLLCNRYEVRGYECTSAKLLAMYVLGAVYCYDAPGTKDTRTDRTSTKQMRVDTLNDARLLLMTRITADTTPCAVPSVYPGVASLSHRLRVLVQEEHLSDVGGAFSNLRLFLFT